MTNDGGRANEPTSYGLQPPRPPGSESSTTPARPEAAPPISQVPTPGAPASPLAAPADHSHRRTEQSLVSPAAPAEPGSGRVIGDRYRLVSRLGHGGMGTVWKAHDEVVDREVAVKEPRVPDHLPEQHKQTVYQRMRREARAAARIDHPSVVAVHDVVIAAGQPWIVMELVRGHSLADRSGGGPSGLPRRRPGSVSRYWAR